MSLETLLVLIRDFQQQKITPEVFIETFQDQYFNGRVFEQVPESIRLPMENIVLAVGLTELEEEERDVFGSAISPAALHLAVTENLPLIEKAL